MVGYRRPCISSSVGKLLKFCYLASGFGICSQEVRPEAATRTWCLRVFIIFGFLICSIGRAFLEFSFFKFVGFEVFLGGTRDF